MASIIKKFHSDGYAIKIDCVSNSTNTANNTTNVTVTVHLVSLKSGYNINSSVTKNGTLTVDGTTYNFTFSAQLSSLQNKTIFTKTVNISHGSDGKKTLSIAASLGIQVTLSGTFYNYVTASGSVALSSIARKTPVVVSGSATFGTEKWIGHTRASSDFTVTLRYKCGSASGTIKSKSATNETYWAPPKSLQSQIPKATSINITVYCDTYSGNTLIGTTSTSFTCNIAADCVPVIKGGTFTNGATGGTEYWQSVSQVRAEIDCEGAYGSTITKYVMTIENKPVTNYGNIIWSYIFTGMGTKDIALTITDSRGKTAKYTWQSAIYVKSYDKPSITNFVAQRTLIDENDEEVVSNLGTIGYFSADVTFHENAINNNVTFMYRPKGGSIWTSIEMEGTKYRNYNFSNTLASGSAYELKLVAEDGISTNEFWIILQNVFPLISMSSSGTGIAFGKECNMDNRFVVDMDASFGKWCGIKSLQVTESAYFDNNSTFSGTSTFNGKLLSTYNGGTAQLNGKALLLDNGYNVISHNNNVLYINQDHSSSHVYLTGTLTCKERGTNTTMFKVDTSDDSNGNGDGGTMLGYYQTDNNGYGHYFRGKGRMYIDNHAGLQVAKDLIAKSWLSVDTVQYATSGGWVNSSGTQTWGIGFANHIVPTASSRYLGVSNARWEGVYLKTSPNVSSDMRLKDNIEYIAMDNVSTMSLRKTEELPDEITNQDMLVFIRDNLFLAKYDYKFDTSDMNDPEIKMTDDMRHKQIGFIAQDISEDKIGKLIVTEDRDGYLSYEMSNYISVIAGALKAEIQNRDMEILSLREEIEELKQLLSKGE